MKRDMKRLLKKAAVWLLAIALMTPLLESAWTAMATEPVIESPPPIVVFINEGTVSGMSAEDLAKALEDLKEDIKNNLPQEYKNVEIIIKISDAKLDASKTDEWYVYDHYDSGYWDSAQATPDWYSYFNVEPGSELRPFFSHTQGAVAGMDKWTASDWVNANPRPKNYGGGVDTLGIFDQHINVREVGRNTMIDFVGYYNSAYFDFMLYPCEIQDDKLVKFDINSSAVNGHTLGSAGFLINAGFDGDGNIVGYYLCYHYNTNSNTASGVPSEIRLYKFKSGVNPNSSAGFHNYKKGLGSGDVVYGDFFETEIAKYTINPVDWRNNMSVTLEISTNSLVVYQKETGAAAATAVKYEFNGLDDTSYNGFGPIVGYVTHSCIRATLFTFSNIKMYQTNPDNLKAILDNANLPSAAEIYFADLSDEKREGADYDNAIGVIKDEGIHYLPDYSGSALDTDAELKGAELTETRISDLANEIANYIIETYQKPAQADDSEPVARLTLVNKEYGANDSNGGRYPAAIQYIRRDLIDGAATVYCFDILSEPSNGEHIVKYSYTVTDPDGTPVTVEGDPDHDSVNGLLLRITNDGDAWPAGEYTVTLTVTDSAGKTASDTKKFTVIEDVTPPEITDATINFEDGTLTFSASDIGINDRAPDAGEVTAYGISKYELVLNPADGDFEYNGSAYKYDEGEGVWIYTGYPAPSVTAQSREETAVFNTVPLPEGSYTMVLKVYDEAGNCTEIALPTVDYVNETLTGLNGSEVYPGLGSTSESGTAAIDESWIGGNVTYASPNAQYSQNGGSSSGTTNVKIILPDRPDAPVGVDAESTGDGYIKLTGVDGDMEYRSVSGSEYADADGGDGDIIVSLDEYKVRYKAVRNKSFAGKDTSAVTVPTYAVEITVNLDGGEWMGNDAPVISLKAGENGAELTDLSKTPAGTYQIYANGEDTGKTVTVTDRGVDGELNYYTLALESGEGVEEVGALGKHSIQTDSDKWAVLEGSEVTVSAKLKGGYGWVTWDGGNTYEDQRTSFAMPDGSLTLKANSEYNAVAVVVNLDDSEAGENTDWGDRGKPVITYMSETGDEITSLKGMTGTFEVYIDGEPSGKYVEVEEGALTDPDNGVVLNFYTLTLTAGNGVDSVFDNTANIEGAAVTKIYLEGTTVNISAQTASGYYWRYWDDNDASAGIETQNAEVTVNRNISLTAYASKNIVTVNINKDGLPWRGRTVTLVSVSDGSVTTNLSNVPDGAYKIYMDGADTGETITVSGGSAEKMLDYYTLTLIAGNGGVTTSGGGVYLKGTAANINASLNYGYQWNGWFSDTGGIIGGKSYLLIIDGTITLTAQASYSEPYYNPNPPPGSDVYINGSETEEPEEDTGTSGVPNSNAGSSSSVKTTASPPTVYIPDPKTTQTGDTYSEDDETGETGNEEELPAEITSESESETQKLIEDPPETEGEPDNLDGNTDFINSGNDIIDETETANNNLIKLSGGRAAKDLGDGVYEILDSSGIPIGYVQLIDGEKIEEIDIDDRLIPGAYMEAGRKAEGAETGDEQKIPALPVTGGFAGTMALLLGAVLILAGIVIEKKDEI